MMTSTDPVVVLGIVLNNSNSVLLVRRRGEERWIFPGGKSEPGEDEATAVVREVMEETGVRCQTEYSIGKRTHPESNRELSYWFCKSLSDAITIGDTEEIAEGQWLKISESLSLLGSSVYEPVRKILMSLS